MTVHRLQTRKSDRTAWQVSKTIKPSQRGAIKLARLHGEALVCVRYRESPEGTERLTTIELIIERAVIQKHEDPIVAFKIKPEEEELRRLAQSKGATYHGKNGMWRLKRSEVLRMGMKSRIAVTRDQLYQEHVHP